MWVLRIGLWSSARAVGAFNPWDTSPVLCVCLTQAQWILGWSGPAFVDQDFFKLSANISRLCAEITGVRHCTQPAPSSTLKISLQDTYEACQVNVWHVCIFKHLETQKSHHSWIGKKPKPTPRCMWDLFVWWEPRCCSDFSGMSLRISQHHWNLARKWIPVRCRHAVTNRFPLD